MQHVPIVDFVFNSSNVFTTLMTWPFIQVLLHTLTNTKQKQRRKKNFFVSNLVLLKRPDYFISPPNS